MKPKLTITHIYDSANKKVTLKLKRTGGPPRDRTVVMIKVLKRANSGAVEWVKVGGAEYVSLGGFGGLGGGGDDRTFIQDLPGASSYSVVVLAWDRNSPPTSPSRRNEYLSWTRKVVV